MCLFTVSNNNSSMPETTGPYGRVRLRGVACEVASSVVEVGLLPQFPFIGQTYLSTPRNIGLATLVDRYVDDVISRIDRMFPEMSIHLSRPNGTSAMLLVTLGKVLKVIVVMRSLFIDRTIVKGYNEDVHTEDGKVTDHATTALLHYQLPQMPDVVVRSFMLYAVGLGLRLSSLGPNDFIASPAP
ncbi:Mediator of RNA polymerase II transcription subunit 27 [Chelonia mydas]|uniref:Mediator of RNA polymerase II transcription subunit 27 n=1 Tax=Chelonia mydas TaxID=8469 RepID=M7C2M1_CHEMY|nr:Mediator of RNA polymerase II transcription subunit 27 [Chelonia mydas]